MSDLEQICLMSRDQNTTTCVGLITRAISHKNIYTFGELLNEASIKSLKNSGHHKAFNTLELFAFGNYQMYKGMII